MVDDETMDALADAVQEAEHTVALTGAGVSTASGVPDFRGEDGLWERYDPSDFHRRRLDADPEGFWTDRLELRADLYEADIEPNAAHEALAAMEASGQLDAVLTQNVDGLHAAAGSESAVELHGSNVRVACDDCGRTRPADPVFERAHEGERPPRCETCSGVLRPDVVLFGERPPEDAFDRAQRQARRADVFLAVGSSLTVRPASTLPEMALEGGATLAVVNFDPTPVTDRAAFDLRADVTAVLPELAAHLGAGGGR